MGCLSSVRKPHARLVFATAVRLVLISSGSNSKHPGCVGRCRGSLTNNNALSISSDHARHAQLRRTDAVVVAEGSALLADHHRVQRTGAVVRCGVGVVGRRGVLATTLHLEQGMLLVLHQCLRLLWLLVVDNRRHGCSACCRVGHGEVIVASFHQSHCRRVGVAALGDVGDIGACCGY